MLIGDVAFNDEVLGCAGGFATGFFLRKTRGKLPADCVVFPNRTMSRERVTMYIGVYPKETPTY